MKKMNIMLAAGAILLAASATAQEKGEFQKNNWFLTAGAHTEALMNTNGYVTGTGKVGAGIWFNQWAGIKLEGVAGNTHLLTDSRGQVFGAELSYMAHLYGGKEYKPFNLNGVLGMGFFHHKFGTILEKYSYMNVLTGNLGVQAVYNITPRWSVYLEPGLLVQPKYYDVNNKDNVVPSFYINVGLSYTFKDMFKNLKKKESNRNSQLASTQEDVEWLNQQINDMRGEVEELKKEVEATRKANADQKVVLEPIQGMPAVSIQFDAMGSFLEKKELEKLEDVSMWMQDHPNSITLIPFADLSIDNDKVNQIKKDRVEAIRKVLTEKYGIDGKRILTAKAEEMGYQNKTSQEVLIVFMTE